MASLHRDFTEGSIRDHLVRFSLPFLLSNFVQALYSVADMWIVGKFTPVDGVNALAGVTNGAQVTNLIVMMVSGLTVGGTILVSQFFGARRDRDVSETIGTMLSVMALLGAALTIAMIAASGWILRLMNVPEAAFAHAKRYTDICLLGTLFIFGYNAVSAVQRGLGDSKRPLIFVSIACALNVGLDLLLVGAFGMAAAGAAWATIASQAVSLVLSAWYLSRRGFAFDFRLSSFRIRRDKLALIIKLGLPSSVQSTITSFSFMFMTGIVNTFGNKASAAVGIVGRFNSFAILPAIAMSAAVSSMAAQNIGAGLYDRATKAARYGIAIAFAMSAAVFAIAQLFPSQIMSMMLNQYDAQVVEYGTRYIRGFALDYLVVPFVFCMNGLLNGAGHTSFTLLNSMLASVLLRAPAAYLLSKTDLQLAGVGLAAPAASLAAGLLAAGYLLSGRWRKNPTGIRRESAEEALPAEL
ncbi:MAG: MATE family efflux transporter [Clostridiales bacterium]|nr:MATE family efflux transporter [Clostridiales bacterium]